MWRPVAPTQRPPADRGEPPATRRSWCRSWPTDTGVHKELSVALGACDRRIGPPEDRAAVCDQRSCDLVAHSPVDGGVTDHAAATIDLGLACLELWFDENDEITARSTDAQQRRQRADHGDEGKIGDDQVDLTADRLRCQVAHVESLEHRHSWVSANLRMQLT